MFYVYMVQCNDGSLYTGYTDNLSKRIAKHNQGQGAKYTRARRPVTLVYSEEYESKNEAMSREKKVQRLKREQKLKLINSLSCNNEVRKMMPEDIIVRDATNEDLPEIVAIYNSTVAGRMVTADTACVTVESKQEWFREHSPQHRPLWVAVQGNEILAWLSFQSFYGRPAYQITAELSIYVKEAQRQKGLGKLLLAKALAEGPLLGLKNVLGFIFGHNLPSLALFEQFGFARWGTLPAVAELDGVPRDLVIVGKRLES